MIIELYNRMLRKYKVFPTYSICNIYNKIMDKKNYTKYQTLKKTNSMAMKGMLFSEDERSNSNINANSQYKCPFENEETTINNNSIKNSFRKRTIKSKYDDSEISDKYEFSKTYPCVECLMPINLYNICSNFKDMNKDLEWALCENCNTKILPKLRIKYIFDDSNLTKEISRRFSSSLLSEYHNCNESEVLNSPYHLKYNFFNSSFIESRLKLDVDYFKIKFNAIFWNSIWYFDLKNLPYDFMSPYYEEDNNKSRKNSNNIFGNSQETRGSIKSKKSFNINLNNPNDRDSNVFSLGNSNANFNLRNNLTNDINITNIDNEKILIKNDEDDKSKNKKRSTSLIEKLMKNKKFNSTDVDDLENPENYNFSSIRTFENLNANENSEFEMEINKEFTEDNYLEKLKGLSSNNLGINPASNINNKEINEEKDKQNLIQINSGAIAFKNLTHLGNFNTNNTNINEKGKNQNQKVLNIIENIKSNNKDKENKQLKDNKTLKYSQYGIKAMNLPNEADTNTNTDDNKTNKDSLYENLKLHKSQRSYDFSIYNKLNFNNLDMSEAFNINSEEIDNIKEPYKFITTPKGNNNIFSFINVSNEKNQQKNPKIFLKGRKNTQDMTFNSNFRNYESMMINNNKNPFEVFDNNINTSNEEKINISSRQVQTININNFEVKNYFNKESKESDIDNEDYLEINKNKRKENIANTPKKKNINNNGLVFNSKSNEKGRNKIIMSLSPKIKSEENFTHNKSLFIEKDSNDINETFANLKKLSSEDIFNKLKKEKINNKLNFINASNSKNQINSFSQSETKSESQINFPTKKSNSTLQTSNSNSEIKKDLYKIDNQVINSEYSELKGDKNISKTNDISVNKKYSLNLAGPINLSLKNSKVNQFLNDSSNSFDTKSEDNSFTLNDICNKKYFSSKLSFSNNSLNNKFSPLNKNLNSNNINMSFRKNSENNMNKEYAIGNNNIIINNAERNNISKLNSNSEDNLLINNSLILLGNSNNSNSNINNSSPQAINNSNTNSNNNYNYNDLYDSNDLSNSINSNKNSIKISNKKSSIEDKEKNNERNSTGKNTNNLNNKNTISTNINLNKDDLINDCINQIDSNFLNIDENNNLDINASRKTSYNKLKTINEEEEIKEREFNSNFILQENLNLNEIRKEKEEKNSISNLNIRRRSLDDNKINPFSKKKGMNSYNSFNIKEIIKDKEKFEMLNLHSRYHTQETEEYYLHTIYEDQDNDVSRVTSKSDKIYDIFNSSSKKRKSDLDGSSTPSKLNDDMDLFKRFSTVKDILSKKNNQKDN